MSDFADVSVIMPAYNNADTIQRALASIAAQTLRPQEVIVVDDGSSDATIAAVQAMGSRMNGIRLRLFRQENNGAGAARNQAVIRSNARWLAFLDADDEWLPQKLERSLAICAAGNLRMSSHNLYGVSKHGQSIIDSRARWLTNPGDPYRTLFLRGFISSSTVVLRREDVVAAGGFDATLRSAQDYELWLAVLARIGNSFQVFDEPLLRYTLAEDGITSRIDRKVACSMAILDRHMGILKRLPGAFWRLLLLRVLIIHLEAIRGHRARGHWTAALAQMALFPLRLTQVIAKAPFADGGRPDYLSRLPQATEVGL